MNQNPTQVNHGWRATTRTAFAVLIGLASVLPVVLATTGLDTTVYGAQVLAVAAAVTRVLALPAVNQFITVWLPWLAAAPSAPTGRHAE